MGSRAGEKKPFPRKGKNANSGGDEILIEQQADRRGRCKPRHVSYTRTVLYPAVTRHARYRTRFLISNDRLTMSVVTAAPPVLLPELLGVSPHFVVDTIVNISNNSVEHCVDAMEEYLNHWADKRADRLKGLSGEDDWDSRREIEQGIVSFQTLLESHMDIALDCFEVWCMRNIFTIPAELPVVVPHQAGLILDQPASKEQELLADIDDLRRRIQVVRISFVSFRVSQGSHPRYF